MKNLRMFLESCGTGTVKNVLLTTTQCSNVNSVQGKEPEEILRDGGFWKELLSKGASLERFTGTRESGLALILKLMGKKPRLPHTHAGQQHTPDVRKPPRGEFILRQKQFEETSKCRGRESPNSATMYPKPHIEQNHTTSGGDNAGKPRIGESILSQKGRVEVLKRQRGTPTRQ